MNGKDGTVDEKFTQIRNKLITLDIHEKAFRIACYLISHSKNGICYPSEYTIAQELNMSRNKVREYLDELEERKVISIEKRVIGTGKKAPSKYTISKDYLVPKKSKQKLLDKLTEEFMSEPVEKVELFDYDWLNGGE